MDPAGNAYAVVGAFVVKLNTTGTNITSSTTLGSPGATTGNGIALDTQGNVYVAGGGNAFVAKLNPDLSKVLYTKLLGDSDTSSVFGIAVDSEDSILTSGRIASTNFPVTSDAELKRFAGSHCLLTACTPFGNPPIVTTCGDAFVAKLNAADGALVYSTYLSGSDEDAATAIAVSPGGAAYVAGFTRSDNFPTAAPQPQIPALPQPARS